MGSCSWRVAAFGREEPGFRNKDWGGEELGFSSAPWDWGKPLAFDRTAVEAPERTWAVGGYGQKFLTRRRIGLCFYDF